jgi:DNA ligase (NAD+)
MDVKYLGEALLEQLIQRGYVAKVTDLYRLKREDLLELDQMGEASADKVLMNLEKSKQNPLWRLLHGLGIPHVGGELSKLLARECKTLDAMKEISEEKLLEIKGIGPTIAQAIRGFFSNEHNRALVAELRTLGLNLGPDRGVVHLDQENAHGEDVRQEDSASESSVFQGKTIVFTGVLQRHTRSEAEKLVENAGGNVSPQVTSTTDLLIVGDKPSKAKLEKAKKFGVKVLGEEGWDAAGGS